MLFVCHYYPPHCGGIENVVRQEAVGLAARGVDVAVLTSGRRTETIVRDGVRVVRIAAWNGAERRAGVPFPLMSPRLFGAGLRWARWADVVHVHDCLYMTSWAALIAVVVTRTPLLMTQHVSLVRHPSALVRGIETSGVRGPRQAPAACRARRVFHRQQFGGRVRGGSGEPEPRRMVHLPNGVDSVQFRPADSAAEQGVRAPAALRELPQGRPLVLFVGRLVSKKEASTLPPRGAPRSAGPVLQTWWSRGTATSRP